MGGPGFWKSSFRLAREKIFAITAREWFASRTTRGKESNRHLDQRLCEVATRIVARYYFRCPWALCNFP
jgi:hypothetical protein